MSQVSDICIPAPGAPCGSTPFHFTTPGTFTFLVDNTALPQVCSNSRLAGGAVAARPHHGGGGGGGCKLRMITKVFHDGQLVPSSTTADPRVVSITFNNKLKFSIVVGQVDRTRRLGLRITVG